MKKQLIFLFLFLLKSIYSLKVDDYISSVEELMKNEEFLNDYRKKSLELFSQPDYLHGLKSNDFPCEIPSKYSQDQPKTVHQLGPSDIQCVAAIGDSLTAGLGAHAATPVGLFIENRGSSWSIGGDCTFNDLVSFPNILRQYNSQLKGYSTKRSVIFLKGQNSSHNGLNVAKSGDRSYHMINQSQILLQRFKSNELCHLENDWKIITFFVGGNDLCIFCEDLNKHRPSNYARYVNETLYYLSQHFPRTFVNLVLVLDVRNVKELNAGGAVCRLLHNQTCPCAAFPSDDDARTLDKWIPKYHKKLIDLVNSGQYDQRDDFTVVIQPFMAHTKLPRTLDGQIDYSYFAPDCFHFSGKGHSRAAVSLWNNMLQPVGQKQWKWHDGEYTFQCPSKEKPYFFTRKNSLQSMERFPQEK